MAAGYDTGASVVGTDPAYAQLEKRMAELKGPEVEELRRFYADHQLAEPGETLSRYISFAMVVGPPPHFSFLAPHDQLPPGALAIEGFQEVLADFYPHSGLGGDWEKLGPRYDREIARLRPSISPIVLVCTSYLREVLKPGGWRSFTVVVEPLVGARTNFRNIVDHYWVIVGTTADVPLDEIRHAFLHFLIDPLPIRFQALVDSKHELLQVAARAPRLPSAYQQDFVAFFTECLIRGIELRLRRPSQRTPEALEAALAEADRSGYILVRPLVAQLQKFEQAEPAMHYYFPELLKGIDVAAEQKRFQNFAFAPAEERQESAHTAEGPANELDRWLTRGERQLAMQDAAGAVETFQQVLVKYPDLPRGMYDLAIASVLTRDSQRARTMFEKLVAPSADPGAAPVPPEILAWSHVYLGRIHDVAGEREQALAEYHAAMAVAAAPQDAIAAAQRGIASGYKRSGTGASAEPRKP